MSKPDRQFWLPYIILLILILLRLIPIFYPDARAWGFNHLIFLPEWYTYIFFAFAAIALIVPFIPGTIGLGGNIIDWFTNSLAEGKRLYFFRLCFIFIMAFLFIKFAAPTHFLGDGYDVIYNLAAKTGIHVKWSEIGITQFMIAVRSVLGEMNEYNARLAFQIVSVLSGIVSLYFFVLISKVITESKTKRYYIFISSFLSGGLLLYFGYAEYYPILWIFFTGNIYFVIKYIQVKRGLLLAWVFLLAGMVFHLQMLVLLPGTIYATFTRGQGLNLYRNFKKLFWGMAGVAGICLIAAFIYKYTSDLYFEDIFLPPFSGKPIDTGYAIFSLSHLSDIFNELILLSPTLFIFLIGFGRHLKNVFSSRVAIGLGITALACLVFLFVIDPKLGMARDWDLFSFSTLPAILLVLIILPDNNIIFLKRMAVPVTIFLLISPLPYLLTNLGRSDSIKYFQYVTDLDPEKSLSSVVVLMDYFKRQDNMEAVDSLKTVYNSRHTRVIQYNMAMAAMDEGNLDLSMAIIRSMTQNKFDGDYQRVLGRYYYLRGDYLKALDYLDRAIQLRKYNSLYFWQRGMVYIGLTKYDKALDDMRRAYDLDNSSLRVLDGLAFLFTTFQQYDSSIYYARKLVELDSSQSGAYYILARSYLMKRDPANARRYADQFIRMTEGNPVFSSQREELIRLRSGM